LDQKPFPATRTQQKGRFSDQVRRIADQLQQETDLQIKATSRILGAAAQIAENHDHLINEVVEMVEEDLDQPEAYPTCTHTVDTLKQEFRTLRAAKAHFGLKASSWSDLVRKVNALSGKTLAPSNAVNPSVLERLATIETEIKIMRADMRQILFLLKQFLLENQ